MFNPEVFGCDAANNGNSFKSKLDNIFYRGLFKQSDRNRFSRVEDAIVTRLNWPV